MFGTIINTLAIVGGGLLGTLFGNRIRPEITDGLIIALGFATAAIGIQSTMSIGNFLVALLSIAIGVLIGMLLRLDDRITALGDRAKAALLHSPFGKGPFSEGFVTCSIMFCSGSMAILGSIRAALNHDYSILLTKSVLDAVFSVTFSAVFGIGVVFSGMAVLVYQGAITLLAGTLEPLLSAEVISEMSGVGGPVFLAMACNLIGIGKERFKVGDMIPCLFLPILLVPLAHAIGLY